MARKRETGPDALTAPAEKKARDNFNPDVITLLAKRAAFICSNPHCRAHTLAPSAADPAMFEYSGVAAHITAAAEGGPRYNTDLTPTQRASAENGIFLCAVCATLIDKNNGIGHPVALLESWKIQHEEWVKTNLNKRVYSEAEIKESVLAQVSEVRDTVQTIEQRQALWLPLVTISLRIDLTRPIPAAELGDFRAVLALFDPAVRGGEQIWVAARARMQGRLHLSRCFWLTDPRTAHGVTEALPNPVERIVVTAEMYRRGPVESPVGLSRHRGVILVSPAILGSIVGFEVSANGHRLFGADARECAGHRVLPEGSPQEPQYFEEDDTFLGHPPIQAAPVPWPEQLLGATDPFVWSFVAPKAGTYSPSRGEYFVEDALPKPSLPLTWWDVDLT